MSISNEALTKVRNVLAEGPLRPQPAEELIADTHKQLVREIETQAVVAQQQIAVVRTQQASKQREMRMAQLTRSEVDALPPNTAIYEGVGKMFATPPPPPRGVMCVLFFSVRLANPSRPRFVSLPVSELKDKLDGQIKESQKDYEGLGKKLSSLEITQKNSQEHISRILRGGA